MTIQRFIKVNNQWIDTLEEQQEYGRYYYNDNGIIKYWSDEYGVDYTVGKLQDEGNIRITDTLDEFFKQHPNKGYKSYLKYCEENSLNPIKKSEFKKRKLTLQ